MRSIMLAALSLAALAAITEPVPASPQLSSPPASQRPGTGHLNLATEHRVSASGSVRSAVTATFSVLEYMAYKEAVQRDPHGVARKVLPASTTRIEEAAPSVRFEDKTGSMIFERTDLGAVRWTRDGAREFVVENGPEFDAVAQERDRTVARFTESGSLFGLKFSGTQSIFVPGGSIGIEFDAATRGVRWRRGPESLPSAPTEVAVMLTPVERVLPGAYKAYGFDGEHWVGRVRVDNTGPALITRFALRHRVVGYSEWSPWTKLADVAPGESAVLCLYPILAAASVQLRSDTPTNLLVEWRYVDGEGTECDDSDSARLVLLGGNDFIFARSSGAGSAGTFAEKNDNADLLAAWVSRDDSIVREVAALGAKRAGGAPASQDIYSAVATLKGLYETLVANDITYQHPPSLADTTLSFSSTTVQNIKFPRDVLRDRSGTCVDLAVLYASLVHAAGLPAFLCVVPGHCFPVVGMPDGSLSAVEVTGVGGGGRMGADAATFGDVFLYGERELAEALAGPHVLVDLRHQWTHGVSCPELPPLTPDAVSKVPLRESIPSTKVPHLAELREEQIEWFTGTFELLLSEPGGAAKHATLRSVPSVDARTFLVVLTQAELTRKEGGGATTRRTTTQIFEGRTLFNSLRCVGLRKYVEVEGVAGVTHLPCDSLELTSWKNGLDGQLTLTDPKGGDPVVLKVTEQKR